MVKFNDVASFAEKSIRPRTSNKTLKDQVQEHEKDLQDGKATTDNDSRTSDLGHAIDLRKKSLFNIVDMDRSGALDENEFGQLVDLLREETEKDLLAKMKATRTASNAKRKLKVLACLMFVLVLFLALSVTGTSIAMYVIVDKLVPVTTNGRVLMDKETHEPIRTASTGEEHTLDSRLPDNVWDELKYIDVRSPTGGSVHMFVLAVSRTPCESSLHGTYVQIHSSIGTITLDGDIMTFSDDAVGHVFKNAGFEVVKSGRRLAGIFELIGFFNSIPAFDGWDAQFDAPPKVPAVFYANATVMYSCKYGHENLCDQVGILGESRTMFDDLEWSAASMEMFGDLNTGFGKEVYHSLPNWAGWTYERHMNTNAQLEHKVQIWQPSGEAYFCRTEEASIAARTWLSPTGAAQAAAAYRGMKELEGVQVHHFVVKPRQVEHMSLDYYMLADVNQTRNSIADGSVSADVTDTTANASVVDAAVAVVPFLVRMRLGPECHEIHAAQNSRLTDRVRYIAYHFHAFREYAVLPPEADIYNLPTTFNETVCGATIAYTDQEREGPKITHENMIRGLDPFNHNVTRSALSYVHRFRPNATAKEIVEWENALTPASGPEYLDYQIYMRSPDEGYNDTLISLTNYTEASLNDHRMLMKTNEAEVTVYSSFLGKRTYRQELFNHDSGRKLRHYLCKSSSRGSCSDSFTFSTAGFPFDMGRAAVDAALEDYQKKRGKKSRGLLPCDIEIGAPIGCKGEISCAISDHPVCCGVVTGSFSGAGSWDCSDDFSQCQLGLSISGGLDVGVPKCDWCPSLASFSVKYERSSKLISCCKGDFTTTKDQVSLTGSFAGGVLNFEASAAIYDAFDEGDTNKCNRDRPNYINNYNRDFTISGKVYACFIFCFDLAVGDPIMATPGPSAGYEEPCPCSSGEYCEHDFCHPKKGIGEHVGWTAGWKCHSGLEYDGKCCVCHSNSHCPSGQYCEWGKCHWKLGCDVYPGPFAHWKCKKGWTYWHGKCGC